jgi:hypothetical protein
MAWVGGGVDRIGSWQSREKWPARIDRSDIDGGSELG